MKLDTLKQKLNVQLLNWIMDIGCGRIRDTQVQNIVIGHGNGILIFVVCYEESYGHAKLNLGIS